MRKASITINLFIIFTVFLTTYIFYCTQSLAQDEISREEIVIIATNAVKVKELDLSGVEIIYDDGNKLWEQQIAKYPELANSPNFGIFKNGFMKNYRTVYFDFDEPQPDIWVFIDKDTGQILEVFSQQ